MNDLRQALADDIDLFIRLHDRELDASAIAWLVEGGFPGTLNLLPESDKGVQALAAMSAALVELKPVHVPGEAVATDQFSLLAADFAAIYLNNVYGSSPYESVWLHDEHLACQQPMFELRALYAAAGLRVDDWRKRYDDHLVLQMQYLAHRLRAGEAAAPISALGQFIDMHIGYWLPDFAARVAGRCDTPFYAALAMLTAAWFERLREVIEDVSGDARLPRESVAQLIREKFAVENGSVAPLKFMPGAAGPSW